jgi:hypothetical protein
MTKADVVRKSLELPAGYSGTVRVTMKGKSCIALREQSRFDIPWADALQFLQVLSKEPNLQEIHLRPSTKTGWTITTVFRDAY